MMRNPSLPLTILLLLGSAARLSPCDVTAEIKPTMEKGRIDVRIFVDCIHRSCPLAIAETQLQPEGLTIVRRGEWARVEDRFYAIDLVISLNAKNGGIIRVVRDCPKRGRQEETVRVNTLAAAN